MRTSALFLLLVSVFVISCKDKNSTNNNQQAQTNDTTETETALLPGGQPDAAVGNWKLSEMVINAELSAEEKVDVEKHMKVQLEHQKLMLHKDGTYDFEFPSSVTQELKINRSSGKWSISDDNTVFYINSDPTMDFVDKYEIVQLDDEAFVYNDTLDIAKPTLTYIPEVEKPQLQ